MAYLSHSPYRFRNEHLNQGVAANASLLARSALVAIGAGAVIVCLSGAVKQPAGPDQTVAVKADRIAAPQTHVASAAVEASAGADVRRDASGRIVYVNDPAARTTTVSRDATVGLSPQSPLGGGH